MTLAGFVGHVIARAGFWALVYLLIPVAQAVELGPLLRDAWRDWRGGR